MKTVRDIMTTEAHCIAPDETLAEVAKLMGDLDVGSFPVCDNDRLIGMITDRDIAVRAVARGEDPQKATAREVMTPEIVYVFDDQDVEEAARLFEAKKIRRLPVLSRAKRLVGIISIGDLAVNASTSLGGEVLKEVSEPSHAQAK